MVCFIWALLYFECVNGSLLLVPVVSGYDITDFLILTMSAYLQIASTHLSNHWGAASWGPLNLQRFFIPPELSDQNNINLINRFLLLYAHFTRHQKRLLRVDLLNKRVPPTPHAIDGSSPKISSCGIHISISFETGVFPSSQRSINNNFTTRLS